MDFARARANMVDSQLRTNKVSDAAVLEAFSSVPRELFLREAQRPRAYLDEDVEVGEGRHMMEPMVLARLLQAARIAPGEVVLEVGCASGYATALLARLAATVVALESDRRLAQRAGQFLAELEVDNAVVVQGPLTAGWPEQAPFDLIFVNGAVSEAPAALVDQLAPGGRLLTVLRPARGLGQGLLIERHGEAASERFLFDAAIPWLEGFAPRPGFVF